MSDQNTLYQLGFSNYFKNQLSEISQPEWEIGRITSEHKERYSLRTENGLYEGEIVGNLRFTAQSRVDFPVVGDWVLVSQYDDYKMLIHKIFSRFNVLKRRSVGQDSEIQLIAANIDCAFIVESVGRDFNINRYERYMALCYDSGIEPVLVLNKSDLLSQEEIAELQNQILKRHSNLTLITSSCINHQGIDKIIEVIEAGKTYCFLGSSGVGKSTIINLLLGNEYLKTAEISETIQRGKHTTTRRELVVLKEGGVIIDNPGMREVGVADASQGIEDVFYYISSLEKNCKYDNCSHHHEQGCAVRKAVDDGLIDEQSYTNYLRMIRENIHYESSVLERKQKGKLLSKRIKQYKKGNKL